MTAVLDSLMEMNRRRYAEISLEATRLADKAKQDHSNYLDEMERMLASMRNQEIDDATFIAFVQAMRHTDTRWPASLSDSSEEEVLWLKGQLPPSTMRYQSLRRLFNDMEVVSGELLVEQLFRLAVEQISLNQTGELAGAMISEGLWDINQLREQAKFDAAL